MSLVFVSCGGNVVRGRPNILFAIADDMSHAIAYGHKFLQTRHFDGIAREGIFFTRA